MLTKWHVTLEALQPISIAESYSGDSKSQSLSYIPATTWRGALAQLWAYEVGFDDEAAQQLVEQAVFHDAHAKGTTFVPSYIKWQKNTDFYTDTLQAFLQHSEQIADAFPTYTDGHPLMDSEPFSSNVIMDTSLGIAMSRTRESVADGKLYTMTSIAEGTVFETTASIPEEVIAKIAPTNDCIVYIGKKRFSGFGQTKITFRKAESSERVTTQTLKQRLQPYQSKNDAQTFTIVMAFKSPVIVYDTYLRPAANIDWAWHVAPFLPEECAKIAPVEEMTWGYGDIRNGWQQLWNAPRASQMVLQPGTTYIASYKGLTKEQQDALLQALLFLEEQGIGERTQEGFGEVVIAPTFEQQVRGDLSPIFAGDHATVTEVEKQKLLKQAERFNEQTKYQIPLAQWQTLKALPDPIEAITSKHAEAYMQKRINSNVRNVWRGYVGKQFQQEIQDIVTNYPKRATAAVELFIEYNARLRRMYEKETAKKKGASRS